MRTFKKPVRKDDESIYPTANSIDGALGNESTMFKPPSSARENFSLTPLLSPKATQFPQFTPPMALATTSNNIINNSNNTNSNNDNFNNNKTVNHGSATSSSHISSPKKLLTPIRNLFSSSRSAATTPNSNDALQDAISSKHSSRNSKRSVFKKHSRNKSYGSAASETKEQEFVNLSRPIRHSRGYHVATSSSYPNEFPKFDIEKKELNVDLASKTNLQSTFLEKQSPFINRELRQSLLGPPISMSRKSLNANRSSCSFEENESKLNTKEVCFDEPHRVNLDEKDELKTDHTSISENGCGSTSFDDDEDDDDDDGDDDDDESSQFSFVQDMKGGRNTSIKYYKTGATAVKNKIAENDLIAQDFGYDEGELADYDFDNNGYDDYDDNYYEGYNEEDELHMGNEAYKDFFLNEISPIAAMPVDNDDDDDDDDDVEEGGEEKGEEEKEKGGEEEVARNASVDQAKIETCETGNLGTNFDFPKSKALAADSSQCGRRPFYLSYHHSIEGPFQFEEVNSVEEEQELDILENYLDKSAPRTPQSQTSHVSETFFFSDSELKHDQATCSAEAGINNAIGHGAGSSDGDIHLFDLSSPVINGLTIGHNLRHRSKFNEANASRLFIHREPFSTDLSTRKIGEQSTELLELSGRVFPSFHGSFDEKLQRSVQHNINAFNRYVGEQFKKTSHTFPSIIVEDLSPSGHLNSTDKCENAGSFANKDLSPYAVEKDGNGREYERGDDDDDSFTTAHSSVERFENHNILPSDQANCTKTKPNTSDTRSVSNAESSNEKEPVQQTRRTSICELMGLLSTLESKTVNNTANEPGSNANEKRMETNSSRLLDPRQKEQKEQKEQISVNRNSVENMMGLLATIGATRAELDSFNSNKQPDLKRESVEGVMKFLAEMENRDFAMESKEKQSNKTPLTVFSANTPEPVKEPNKSTELEKIQSHKFARKASFKRYSWFNSQESLVLNNNQGSKYEEVDPTDDTLVPVPLDPDLLDEVNQIPDDFVYHERQPESILLHNKQSFERSLSFKSRPQKMLHYNVPKSNKIETLHKTITFYDRGASSIPSNMSSSSLHDASTMPTSPIDPRLLAISSISRKASAKSISSCPSVCEISEEETGL